MSGNIQDDGVASQRMSNLIQRRLDAAYWPWPLALAYSQPMAIRRNALPSVVLAFEQCAATKGARPFAAVIALKALLHAAGRGEEEAYWTVVSEMEASLIDAVGVGSIKTFGRNSPDSALAAIDTSGWVGRQIDYSETSDLVVAGWREADLLAHALGAEEKKVQFYDVHVHRDQVLEVFGENYSTAPDGAADGLSLHDKSLSLEGLTETDVAAAKSGVATIRAVTECKAWLSERYRTNKPGLPTRDKSWEDAQGKWGNSITRRSYLRAWAEVASDREWMSKEGRRKKKVN